MTKNNILKSIVLAGLALLAVLAWYSPIVFKGYASTIPGHREVIAKNLVLAGRYSAESEKNVVLASARIADEGLTSSRGEKMISLLSAGLYSVTGLPDYERAALYSVIISALALLFFALIVWEKFGFKAAAAFSLIYIFLPVNWSARNPNFYEYTLLFFAVGIWLLFTEKIKSVWAKYPLAGLFFGLSFLSRDAMMLFGPILLVWLWIYRRRAIAPLFVTLGLAMLLFSFGFAAAYGQSSNYHLAFFGLGGDTAIGRDFNFYGHLYPDPYTFHYERDEYLAEKKAELADASYLDRQGLAKRIANVETERIPPGRYFLVAPVLFLKHFAFLVSLENVGGPFIFLLFLLGMYYLYKRDKPLAVLAALWIGGVIFFLSAVVLAQRNHVMDFAFIYALPAALGLLWLAALLAERLELKFRFLNKQVIGAILVLAACYHLVLAAHVTLSAGYGGSNAPEFMAYARVLSAADMDEAGVIATPLDGGMIYALNYATDRSIVKFSSETAEKLLKEDKLAFVFKEFGVTKILGFSPELSSAIAEKTGVEIIADNKINVPPIAVSPTRGLLMNLIK